MDAIVIVKPDCAALASTQGPRLLALESNRGAVCGELLIFREISNSPRTGSASVVVMIKPAEVEHRVRIRDFQNWLESAPKSPAEMALKRRLRELLGR